MSFLDHLDELRKRLIRSAFFVMAAFVVSWFLSGYIYDFLQKPVRQAMVDAKASGASDTVKKEDVGALAQYVNTEVNFTLPSDLKVANGTIVQAGTTIRALVKEEADGTLDLVTAAPWVIDINTVIREGYVIPRKLYQTGSLYMNPENQLVVGTVQGAFNLYIKVAFYAAVFFSVPFLLYQAWAFVAPGLYQHEKRYAAPVIGMGSVFFLLGCAFAYEIAFPRACNFLLGVAAQGHLRTLVTADDYFDLIILIMLGLGLVFEIPTVTFFGARLGLITPGLLLKVWR
ncbi:MAG TPA: twin-arginine translocase subunit TatC, partial [Blastocatellia bacterium]|nr:twin-arginine translocase subunit TatC [Blastocatellia bacterium]